MSDTWFKIDESKPKNDILLNLLKENNLSVRALARAIQVQPYIISWALNKKTITKEQKIKIARFFGKDTIEIF